MDVESEYKASQGKYENAGFKYFKDIASQVEAEFPGM